MTTINLPCLQEVLRATSVVERRTTIPILENILLRADGDTLSATGTDLELQFTARSAVSGGNESWATTVPAQTLSRIVKRLPAGAEVTFTTDPDVTVKSGRSRFKLATLPAEDFPDITEPNFSNKFSIPAMDFRRLLSKTQFAIPTEETRHYLNGVYLHHTNDDETDVLRAVATDGHRLARASVTLPIGAAGIPEVIVPRKAVNEIIKVLPDTTAEVRVSVSETSFRVEVGTATITTKVVDGAYPDYDRVIPKDNNIKLELNIDGFRGAIGRVGTVSTDRSPAIRINIGGGTITVSCQGQNTGDATEEIDISDTETAMTIGFNAHYLDEICRHIDGGTVSLELKDPRSPAILRPSFADAVELFVLMPTRV